MTMDVYYTTEIDGARARLGGEEFRHAVKVMRRREGEKLILVDGSGRFYACKIAEILGRSASLDVLRTWNDEPAPYQVTLAFAPTKNPKRIEWLVEKCTELGVHKFAPVICERSERRELRTDRLERVVVAASKQSMRARFPTIAEPRTYSEFLDGTSSSNATRLIAVQSPESLPLKHNYRPMQDVILCIGPEGDFTSEELSLAAENGFSRLSLGTYRLRTETAALYAVSTVHAMNLNNS